MTSAEQDDTFPKCQHLPILTIIIFGISFFFFFFLKKAIQRQILPTLSLTTKPVLRVEVGVSVGI